jgi:phosphoenolpyruvate synthase/pyruvate phosphate dikinase
VTTDAFQQIMAEAPSIDDSLDRLSRLKPDDREAIRALSVEIRWTLEEIAIPNDLAAAITRLLTRLGEQAAYAVRSSATAEDLPTASFTTPSSLARSAECPPSRRRSPASSPYALSGPVAPASLLEKNRRPSKKKSWDARR